MSIGLSRLGRAAKYAGIAYDTLVRAERADPAFAEQVENARQSYLDRHAENLNRLAFKKNNVVASIVALKAGRPTEYVEKNMSITANFTTELPAEDGKLLLLAMFGQGVTSTFPAAEVAGALSAHVAEQEPRGTDTYGHVQPDRHEAAVIALDQYLS